MIFQWLQERARQDSNLRPLAPEADSASVGRVQPRVFGALRCAFGCVECPPGKHVPQFVTQSEALRGSAL